MRETIKTKVPAPWTPVELELTETRAVAKVWGRVYTWENSLLPVSILTAGKELLAGPATFRAMSNILVDGYIARTEEPFSKITYTPLYQDEDKAAFVVGATAGNIILNIRYTIDYDGFVEMAVSVVPFWALAENPLDAVGRLNGLSFEFPIKKDLSSLYHYWPNGESGVQPDPCIMGSGAVPATGISLPFKPYVWAGWEFGGLGIATESDENVQLTPGTPCITIEEKDDCRVLKWTMLNKLPRQWAGKVDRWMACISPIEYKFGLQATPVKEMNKDRSQIRIHHAGYDPTGNCLKPDENGECMFDKFQKAGVTWVVFHEAWSAIQNYGQAVNEELFKTYVEECHKRGLKAFVYFGYEFATNAPMWVEQRDNYPIKDADGNYVGGWMRQNPCQRDFMVCYASGYSKVLCDRIRYVYDHYDVDGIYTDGTHVPWECANENHGCGYTDEHGVRHVTYPIWALRQHSKDMYEAVHSRPGGINQTHQSSCMLAATVGYADYFFNGESIQNSLHKGFLEFLDLPAFRTEFMGHNIGVPSQMLFYERKGSDVGIEKFTSLSLIHDVLPHTSTPAHLEYMSHFWNELTAFDAGRAKWMPYWFEDRPVKVETENAYCSLYEKDGKYLLALSSFNENVHEVEVTFDGEVSVDYDVFGQNAAVANGNKLTVKMEAFKPNLIRLTKK